MYENILGAIYNNTFNLIYIPSLLINIKPFPLGFWITYNTNMCNYQWQTKNPNLLNPQFFKSPGYNWNQTLFASLDKHDIFTLIFSHPLTSQTNFCHFHWRLEKLIPLYLFNIHFIKIRNTVLLGSRKIYIYIYIYIISVMQFWPYLAFYKSCIIFSL